MVDYDLDLKIKKLYNVSIKIETIFKLINSIKFRNFANRDFHVRSP